MTIQDQVIGALCAWRENRGAGTPGLQSILNVLQNRAKRDGTSVYEEAVKRIVEKSGESVGQFSSMTTTGNPELVLFAQDNDPQWQQALALAQQAAKGALGDLTAGSTLYYAPASIPSGASITLPSGTTIPFPKDWNPDVVTYRATIGGQVFFSE